MRGTGKPWAVLARLLVIGVVLGQCTVFAEENPGEELLDRPAPQLTVSRWTNSEPLSLADLEGKVVLLRWWTAPGCPFCSATAPSLNTLYERYADRDLVIVGLYHHKSTAPLDREHVERYAESFGFQFPLAIDEGWENLRRWWLDTGERGWTSVSFLLDREGIVRWVHPGGEYPPGSDGYAELEATVQELLDKGEEPPHQEG